MSNRQTLGVPADSLLLDCAGVRLAVSREGRGPAVICLHAIGHGGRDFEAFAAAACAQYEVIRIDWPGHGRSGPDAAPLSPERYAELLALVVAQLGVVEPIVIGNSIGGAAALLYAARHPVRALVLCDAGGLVPVSGFVRLVTRTMSRFFAAGARGAGWFARAYAFYYRYVVLPSPLAAAQRERIVAAGYEAAPLLAEAWAGFGRPEADLRGIAASLDVPVWCAWAGRDRVIPLWMCQPAIRKMRRASLSTFKGGHSAFLERPAEFWAGFEGFVAESEVTAGVSFSAQEMVGGAR